VGVPDPSQEYRRRHAAWIAAIAKHDRVHLFVSNLRLVAVVAAVVILWLAVWRDAVSAAWLAAPALAFVLLLVWHARVLNTLDRARRAKAYYERGLSRLDGTWVGTGPDGSRFLDGHPYARDLDLFGYGSLFQLLSTARTEAGEETLASWLSHTASSSDVLARQGGVAELRERIEFREKLAVLAAEAHVSRTGAMTRWVNQAPAGFGAWHAWLFALCTAATTVLAVLAMTTSVTFGAFAAWVAVQAAIVSIWRTRVRDVLKGVDEASYDLGLLSELLERIEGEEFQSLQLKALRRALVVNDVLPSRRIAQLQLLLAVRDAPRNEFVRPFALLLVLRSHAAVAIDRWHARYRSHLALWLEAVGELEALTSLGTYAFEHPGDAFPTLVEGSPVFDARGLRHPLIPESKAVPNDVSLGGDSARVLIVSGSNMSGKSTLLRAVGTNAVLALAGGAVRADSLTLSPLVIGTTIRVEDSLQEGQSRFYAEILRIRDIVEQTSGARPMLFLLDEILHGTNSYDRRIGAEAIVRALVEAGAIGLVTTHDLALTAVTDMFDHRARNVHFEDRIENGVMAFDYQMRDGVVERSNALELMRAVGIKV
jgi:hypothetical protein